MLYNKSEYRKFKPCIEIEDLEGQFVETKSKQEVFRKDWKLKGQVNSIIKYLDKYK